MVLFLKKYKNKLIPVVLLMTGILFSCVNDLDTIKKIAYKPTDPDERTFDLNVIYSDSGMAKVQVYAKIAETYNKPEEVIKLMREISESVAQHGLTVEEISRAKGAVTGGLILGQEDTGSRMSRIGKSELVYGEIMSFDDILAKVRSVTPEQVHQLARDLFSAPATLALVGPFRSKAKFEKVIS